MTDKAPLSASAVELRQQALSRWDNEGGAQAGNGVSAFPAKVTTALTDVELVHLRVRVIALENIVIAMLAIGGPRQQKLASELAEIIRPREGTVSHPLTIEAANIIDGLVQRSKHVADTVA